MAKRGRPKHPDILTPREWEVLALLREGLSNEEIGGRLKISLAGAKYHVSEILGKLGVSSREEAALWQPEAAQSWWASAFAPVAFLWRKASVPWLAPAAAAGVVLVVAAGIGVLVWGLVRTGGGDGEAAGAGGPLSPPDAVEADATPEGFQHVTFAPGETISNDDPGIYFLDPETGAAEGWVMAGYDGLRFPEGGPPWMSADGRLVLFKCEGDGDLPCRAPGQPAMSAWRLLNTETGEIEDVPGPGTYLSLSPDGGTLLVRRAGLGFVSVGSRDDYREIKNAARLRWGPAISWSPNSQAVVVSSDGTTLLVRVHDVRSVELLPMEVRSIDWAPDGSRVALLVGTGSPWTDTPGTLYVFDRDGRELWSNRQQSGNASLPRWSPDGQRLAIQDLIPSTSDPRFPLDLLEVFDGATGAPLYRLKGAIGCGGRVWTADGSRLIVRPYRLHEPPSCVAANLATGEFIALGVRTVPSSTDPSFGISHDLRDMCTGKDFSRVDLTTGRVTPLARMSRIVAWGQWHEPLLAGGRIVFTSPNYGNRGCMLEGYRAGVEAELAIQYPPFED